MEEDGGGRQGPAFPELAQVSLSSWTSVLEVWSFGEQALNFKRCSLVGVGRRYGLEDQSLIRSTYIKSWACDCSGGSEDPCSVPSTYTAAHSHA